MFVSVTRLRLRSNRYLVPFVFHSLRSKWQAQRSAGCLAVRVMRDEHGGFWTKSVWQDEASMRAFMMAASHRKAMPKLLDWCSEAALVHWEQDTSDLPDWLAAHERLVSGGRPSKVRHPTAAHLTLAIPPPRRGTATSA